MTARLYVTALGLSIAPSTASRSAIRSAPGWTDFQQRVRYEVYDVAHLLGEGENVLGAVLGDGWAVGRISGSRQTYFDRPRLLAQLEVTLVDGRTVTILSEYARGSISLGHSWKTTS